MGCELQRFERLNIKDFAGFNPRMGYELQLPQGNKSTEVLVSIPVWGTSCNVWRIINLKKELFQSPYGVRVATNWWAELNISYNGFNPRMGYELQLFSILKWYSAKWFQSPYGVRVATGAGDVDYGAESVSIPIWGTSCNLT